jgi:hypothetical protein
MKPRSHLPFAKPLALAAALLAGAFASLAAQTPTNAPVGSSPSPTNALPALPEIPQSAFFIPTTPQEGKDPFFPRSMRLFASVLVRTNLQTTTFAPPVELHLNGISGTADHRLAIINNQTFEANEEGEVPTNPGRARIRCLEIKADSVLVQVGGEQRVLRLRPGL